MARQMVVNYGFSDIGPWSLQDPSAQSGDMIMRMMARNSISESLQKRIDDAVRSCRALHTRLHLCSSKVRRERNLGIAKRTLLNWFCGSRVAGCLPAGAQDRR